MNIILLFIFFFLHSDVLLLLLLLFCCLVGLTVCVMQLQYDVCIRSGVSATVSNGFFFLCYSFRLYGNL